MSLKSVVVEKLLKYKNQIKITIKVLLYTVLVLLIAEFFSALLINNLDSCGNFKFPPISRIPSILKKLDYFRFTTFENIYSGVKINLRTPIGTEFKKKPLIFFVDSYAYGYGLENEQTISAQISKYTKRPVYNYSFIGWSVQHILWLLKNEKDLDNIKNPEYAIYIFIEDHYRRMQVPIYFSALSYSQLLFTEKNGKFYPEKNIKFYYRSYLYRLLSYRFSFNILKPRLPCFKNRTENKLVKYLKEENRVLKEKWPDIKFVVLFFPTAYEDNDFDSIEEKVEKEGIIVIDGRKIFKNATDSGDWDDDKYYLPNFHPTENMYSLFVPEIAKKLNL